MVESIKELRRICYEGRKGPLTLYNKHVGMRISIYITKLLLYTPITANQVTMSMLIFSVIGSIFLFNGYFIAGLLLIHLSVILDDVDGEIARYRKKSSMLGIYIDTVYHTVCSHLMLFGFAYGIYRIYPSNLLIIFGFLASIFSKSIVVPSIFDTIVTMRTRGTNPKIKSKAKIDVLELEGQTSEYKNEILKIYHSLKKYWQFPSDLVWMTLVYIWELINLKYLFVQPYIATLIFFIIYSVLVICNQIASFIIHTKNNSIESFYVFLFGKK